MSKCGHCGEDGEFDFRSGEEYHLSGYWCYGILNGFSFWADGEPKTPEDCRFQAKIREKAFHALMEES